MNRVAVTGLGIVSALGLSAPEVWDKLKRGESGIAPLPDRGDPPYRFSKGALAWGFEPLQYFEEKELAMIERFAQMAAVAAREAVAQSGAPFAPRAAYQDGSNRPRVNASTRSG